LFFVLPNHTITSCPPSLAHYPPPCADFHPIPDPIRLPFVGFVKVNKSSFFKARSVNPYHVSPQTPYHYALVPPCLIPIFCSSQSEHHAPVHGLYESCLHHPLPLLQLCFGVMLFFRSSFCVLLPFVLFGLPSPSIFVERFESGDFCNQYVFLIDKAYSNLGNALPATTS
jgi:hypothetical protein